MRPAETARRVRVLVTGRVQGVGFRPFVYGLARRLELAGSVWNTGAGVAIDVEGEPGALSAFLGRLRSEGPGDIATLENADEPPRGAHGFSIAASAAGVPRADLTPDLAPCAACLAEMDDPADRRHRYPFVSCTACGPRYTVQTALPWDRARTTMAGFEPCADCRRECETPGDRRFHCQTNACPACGPRLLGEGLAGALRLLAAGGILALKGLGGFHLLVDATDAAAVARLRARKQRPEKPLALLVAGLAAARALCAWDEGEEAALRSPEAPIVLGRAARPLEGVAPGRRTFGVMLPSTPLHHLVARAFERPLVCTSGNRGDEPLVTGDDEAQVHLAGIADGFLCHDRPIARAIDDAVVRIAAGRVLVLRAGRGLAPVTLPLAGSGGLALGGHLKGTIALGLEGRAVVSPHLGDLDGARARDHHRATTDALLATYASAGSTVAADLHPDYATTWMAEQRTATPFLVQHHLAHVLAVVAEHGLTGPCLGLAWDGAGLGTDGGVWGGEAILLDGTRARRVAGLVEMPLLGGAAREPRRSALGALWATFGSLPDDLVALTPAERAWLPAALARAPRCGSVGRLFDAVASLLGLAHRCSFEGQAPALLEELAAPAAAYPVTIDEGRLDWRPLFRAVVADRRAGRPPAEIAGAFHAAWIAAGRALAARWPGLPVVLAGGCFANRILLEGLVSGLREDGRRVYWPLHLPPGDGALALGQLLALRRGLVLEA